MISSRLSSVEGECEAWATSGLAALTGRPEVAPAVPVLGVASRLDAVMGEIRDRSGQLGEEVTLEWGSLLTGRAAMMGFTRQGRRSPNGSCRLLLASDGWVALNLPRAEDRDVMGILAGGESSTARVATWDTIETALENQRADDFIARAHLLGVAASRLQRPEAGVRPWTARHFWPSTEIRQLANLRVVDLSAMWAGPLVAMILASAGAEVTKVESSSRPDGSRSAREFYRWLHPDRIAEAVLDFQSPRGRALLGAMIEAADVVIESSRPRALEQLGVGPSSIASRPGRVWLSITGYGRGATGRDWVAFGDDAAVAGGLVAWDGDGTPLFCGDAIADPVSGIVGAGAVLEALASGGGQLIDLAMSRCAASLVGGSDWGRPAPSVQVMAGPNGSWDLQCGRSTTAIRSPTIPVQAVAVSELGPAGSDAPCQY